ncbi:MAG: MBL fold metallo-hydrolase [Spirochaetaceae bacterium]|nr:MAG: MBL fold metallo-hydrolase [Spirochaetaceae bacterium]
MKIRFWGVRGSIPSPGASTVKYGGNTSCVELRYGRDDEHLVIIDAGTGIKPLGDHLAKTQVPRGPVEARIFLTHTHWDHIMGFPFFTPIFIPGTRLEFFSPVNYEDESLESIIGNQLSYRHFPIRQSELSASITYRELREETLELEDGLTVTTKFLNHPVLCLGYRFEHEGKVVCTVYDNEPFRNVFPTDPDDPDFDEVAASEGEDAAAEENRKLMRFYSGADLLIHDTQYTLREYVASKVGWGHTPFEVAINNAHKARVARLMFFHHDPLRSDDELDSLLESYSIQIRAKSALELSIAREGDVIEV